MKWLLLVLVVAFSYVCTHPVQREHEHGDHDHPDHHLAKRNTDQNAERDEESPASEEAEGDGDPVNNEVDVEETDEEGTCDEKNTDEESNTDETKAPKKLSLKDLQSNHKVGKRSVPWGHGHHSLDRHRSTREKRSHSEIHHHEEHLRSRRSKESENKSEGDSLYHFDPPEHLDRKRRNVGHHERHHPQLLDEVAHPLETPPQDHEAHGIEHMVRKRHTEEEDQHDNHDELPTFESDDVQQVDSPFE
ncbi:hypothetical protein Q1695_006731 [Nippostrongylus brasiliensis]|nr:hypothetical protein Q1695_006731 [Nippostrongylus brasiliensis]